MMRKTSAAVLALVLALLTGCSSGKNHTEDEAGIGGKQDSWAVGNLTVFVESGAAPSHTGEYQELRVEITTAGTTPKIELPDFSRGGFLLDQWQELSRTARENESSVTFYARLEPLMSGELIIPPIRILSGDTISEEVTTEAIPVTVPTLLTEEDQEAAANGTLPALRPLSPEPALRNGWKWIIPGVLILTALTVLMLIILRKKRKNPSEPAPSEKAVSRTETLNPADYSVFYTRAAGIIRDFTAEKAIAPEDLSRDLREILDYYEAAAYTGRLTESRQQGILPRSPGEDKAKMLIAFTLKEDTDEFY